MSAAPSEQLTPTASGAACWIDNQKASAVCPDRFRPLRSTTLMDTISGTSGATSRAAAMAALAFRVSKTVSTSMTSTPPSRRPRTHSA